MDAPREGPGGPVRGGGLFLEQHAWNAPRASSQPRPLPLPLPLPAPWAASPSAASHGASAERPASQLGFEERVRGSQPGHAGS